LNFLLGTGIVVQISAIPLFKIADVRERRSAKINQRRPIRDGKPEQIAAWLSTATVRGLLNNWRTALLLFIVTNALAFLRVSLLYGKLPQSLWIRFLLQTRIPLFFLIPLLWLEFRLLLNVTGQALLAFQSASSTTVANLAIWVLFFGCSLSGAAVFLNPPSVDIGKLSDHWHISAPVIWSLITCIGGLLYGGDIVGKKRLKRIDAAFQSRFSWTRIRETITNLVLAHTTLGVWSISGTAIVLGFACWISSPARDFLIRTFGRTTLLLIWYWFLIRAVLYLLCCIPAALSFVRRDRMFVFEFDRVVSSLDSKQISKWISDIRNALQTSTGTSQSLYRLQIFVLIPFETWDLLGILPLLVVSFIVIGIPFFLFYLIISAPMGGTVSTATRLKFKSPLRTFGGILLIVGTAGTCMSL
jgi:hypothetical protein